MRSGKYLSLEYHHLIIRTTITHWWPESTATWYFCESFQNIYFPLQLSLTLRFFKMSSLDDRLLLLKSVIHSNKEDADDNMKKLRETLASILEELIEIVELMFHQKRISSPDNEFEDDGLSEITKSTSETNPSKSDPSSFQNPTQMIKGAHFHLLMSYPCHIVTSENLDGIAEDKI